MRCPSPRVRLTFDVAAVSSNPRCRHQRDESPRDCDPHRSGDSGCRRSCSSRPGRDRDQEIAGVPEQRPRGAWRSASAPLAGIETIPASMYPLNTRPYSCMPPMSRTARGRTVATRRVCNPAVISTRQSPTVVNRRPSPTRVRQREGTGWGAPFVCMTLAISQR